MNSATKLFKGFAYIEFEDNSSVKKAMWMHGKLIEGRPIRVDFATTRAKASYKPNIEDEGNKLYNKDVQKDVMKKRHKKEWRKMKEEIAKTRL